MNAETEDRFTRMLAELKGRPLRKRFYKQAGIAGDEPPFAVALDGRPVKTPAKRPLALPGREMAAAVVAEWERQGDEIDPSTMPLTRLANTALDRVSGNEARVVAEITDHAGSDLVCYRAGEPGGLVEREAHHWDPVLTWAGRHLAHPFIAVTGLMHQPQPEPTLQAVGEHLSARDAFQLTALHNLSSLTGSALLALALEAEFLDADAAWAAAHVDEDWQIEQWGADEVAQARRAARRAEFDATIEFLSLARRQP